jgi:hypothetical protein
MDPNVCALPLEIAHQILHISFFSDKHPSLYVLISYHKKVCAHPDLIFMLLTLFYKSFSWMLDDREARWSSGQCALRKIAEAKHRS